MEQSELLSQAAKRGLCTLKVATVARAADVSESSVRAWLRGDRVGDQIRSRLEQIIGIEPNENVSKGEINSVYGV